MIKKILLSALLALGLINLSVPLSQATVSSTTNQVIYNGDGVTSTFAFSFNVFNSASENDLVVSKQNITSGAITTLTLTTDYTVSLTHAIPSPGTITLTAGALASGYKLSILRQLPLTQNVRIADNSATPAATTNAVYDRLVMSDQQLQQQLTRAILQNPFATTGISLPAGVAGLVLCWDPTATTITNCTATGVQTIPVPIPNSYLVTINSAGLIDGAAMINLGSIVSSAGIIPVANTPFGTTANKLIKLDSSAKIPALDGSQLTSIAASQITGTIGASQISAIVGAPVAKNTGTIYQAATDGIVEVFGVSSGGQGITLQAYTDSSATPSTLVQQIYIPDATNAALGGLSFIVKKSNYYQIVLSRGTVSGMVFIPIGS